MINAPRRGRPKGATRYAQADREILSKIADLITDAEPPLAPTGAMRKLGYHDSSDHRRLQRKWRATGVQLQQKVRDRRSAAASHCSPAHGADLYGGGRGSALTPSYASSVTNFIQGELERQQRVQDLMDPPGSRAMREMMERQQRMQDLMDPPGARAMREMMERERRIQDLMNPPYLRLLGIYR